MPSSSLRPAAAKSVPSRHLAFLACAVIFGAFFLTACGKDQQPAPAGTTPDPAAAVEPRKRPGLGDTLIALASTPNPQQRNEVLQAILAITTNEKSLLQGEQVVAVGLSEDRWTTNGDPAGVVITNNGDQPLVPTLYFGCYAPAGQAPTVTIEDGEGQQEFLFEPNGVRAVTVAEVPPKSSRLYIVMTDGSWPTGPHDGRMLGVQILPTSEGQAATAAN